VQFCGWIIMEKTNHKVKILLSLRQVINPQIFEQIIAQIAERQIILKN